MKQTAHDDDFFQFRESSASLPFGDRLPGDAERFPQRFLGPVSYTHLIIMQLEDELGVEIPDEVAENIKTVGDALEEIRKVNG